MRDFRCSACYLDTAIMTADIPPDPGPVPQTEVADLNAAVG